MLISVIVCTYNREENLTDCINSILRQKLENHQYEVIIVDNNSIDNTRQIIESIAQACTVKIKYIFEKKQGLSYARNTGIDNSEGEIIVFTDDDTEADRYWLQEIVAGFDSPDVYCAGGPIRPTWLAPRPPWLTDYWIGYLAIHEFEYAMESRELRGPCYPIGANIAFRREVFQELGGFEASLGRKGYLLLSNEESKMCFLIESAGKIIRFARSAVIYHKISKDRLTKKWFYTRMYWQGISDVVLDISVRKESVLISQSIADCIIRSARSGHNGFDHKCISSYVLGYINKLIEEKPDNWLMIYNRIFNHAVQIATDNDVIQRQNEVMQSQIKNLSDQIHMYKSSISWRISSPIRYMCDLVRKILHY